MSTDKNKPPAIAPKVVAPRPDSPGKPHTTPPPPPPGETPSSEVDEETVAGMERASGESKVAVARAGAVKAAAEAIASAKSARKKAAPSAGRDTMSAPADPTNGDTVPAEHTPGASSAADVPVGASMHYSMAGASGTTSVLAAGTQPVGEPLAGISASTPQEPAAAEAQPPASTGSSAAEQFAPRKVRLAVSKVSPWSVMKLAFLLSVAVGIMFVVAIIVFWMILDGMHVFTRIDDFVKQVVGDEATTNILQFVEFSKVVSQATIIAVVNVVLMTALATIMSFLYNVTATLVGGLHVTLTDD